MRAMLEKIVRALVDNPQFVEIRETPGVETIHYQVVVAKSDLGQVIGKKGRIANALRTLAVAVVRKYGNASTVKIDIDGETGFTDAAEYAENGD